MPIGDVCVREVLVATPETTITEAARLMRQHHVGDLVIVAGENGDRVPTGIVTDRDIVLSVIATGLDPSIFTIGDLVTDKLVTVREDLGVFECIQKMRTKGVRRVPVLDAQDKLVGIVSVDDLVQLLGQEFAELGRLISREQAKEIVTRR
jgi:CBS domain-containing protein